MTELADREPVRDDTDWLISDEPQPADSEKAPPGGRRAALAAVGLVAAGALVGGVGMTALRSHSDAATASPTSFTPGGPLTGQQGQGLQGQLPQGQGSGGFAGGPGGVTGEQRLEGTVTAVGASSVTIRTSSGTARYAVVSQTEIVRNGAAASLSAVHAGDS